MTKTAQNSTPASTVLAGDRTALIRAHNDRLRQTFIGGTIMITSGLQALSDADRLAVIGKVQSFDAFTPDNDPYGEHDFGSVTHSGETYFWKIDCYDLALIAHSPDASDPKITRRVLTIMKAEEY